MEMEFPPGIVRCGVDGQLLAGHPAPVRPPPGTARRADRRARRRRGARQRLEPRQDRVDEPDSVREEVQRLPEGPAAVHLRHLPGAADDPEPERQAGHHPEDPGAADGDQRRDLPDHVVRAEQGAVRRVPRADARLLPRRHTARLHTQLPQPSRLPGRGAGPDQLPHARSARLAAEAAGQHLREDRAEHELPAPLRDPHATTALAPTGTTRIATGRRTRRPSAARPGR